MNVCVFCSSSSAVEPVYFHAARDLGQLLGQKKYSLIYGGANVGLMDHLATTVLKYGGRVTGIIPRKIQEKQLASIHLNELVITETMEERKALMRDRSDAFITLPGGFGTLEETLEVITLKQLDYHQKPVVLVNTNAYFTDLLAQFEKSYRETFARENYRKLYAIVSSPSEALVYIENYIHEDLGTKWFHVPGVS
ncbi:MAG TPA: TIGR00730 family Rossman fold protein [Prolixibacteraceae bacterium]|nr:TIGR00730 family Rossman fold protein [Prolixibacteraceae bacterium]